MDMEEYKKWLKDAAICLAVKYTSEEAQIIISWFVNIRGSHERELVGSNRVNAFTTFCSHNPPDGKFSVYDTMMSRLWIYAPYILDEERKHNEGN